MTKTNKKELSKVEQLVKYYSEHSGFLGDYPRIVNQHALDSPISLINRFYPNTSGPKAIKFNKDRMKNMMDMVNMDDLMALGTPQKLNDPAAMKIINDLNSPERKTVIRNAPSTGTALASAFASKPSFKISPNDVNYAALDASPELAPNLTPKGPGTFGTLGTHALAFGAGYGTAKLGDRFKKRVQKKGLDSDTNITGGLFNFGKKQNQEISYLNKRLNKNILSKFMSFDSDDNRKLNYNHPILQNDPDLLTMIESLISDTRSLGKYYTSERDLAKLRKKINQVERYIYNKYPKLFYSNGSNGETTDLRSYLNRNQDVPMDYIPDMASALNQEKDIVDKQLEPGKWRKRLQKWIS